jgi:hypothetical protein
MIAGDNTDPLEETGFEQPDRGAALGCHHRADVGGRRDPIGHASRTGLASSFY